MKSKKINYKVRCTDVILSAFLSHPRYKNRADLIKPGCQLVVDKNNWIFARFLPRKHAKNTLLRARHKIIESQKRSGLWGDGGADFKVTYLLLTAFQRAGLLNQWIKNGVFNYNPFQKYLKDKSLLGYLVRNKILSKSLPTDSKLREDCISRIVKSQLSNGSWNNAVVRTSCRIENLLDLDLSKSNIRLQQSARWLLKQMHDSEKESRLMKGKYIVVHNMISNKNYDHEWKSVLDEMSELNPGRACSHLLPFMETSFALRMLTALGYGKNRKVLNSFKGLLDVQLTIENQKYNYARRIIGSWCACACREMLEKKQRERVRMSARGGV